jgi:hypothetical protein
MKSIHIENEGMENGERSTRSRSCGPRSRRGWSVACFGLRCGLRAGGFHAHTPNSPCSTVDFDFSVCPNLPSIHP